MKYEIIGWTYSNDPSYMDIDDNLKRAYLTTTVIKELRQKKLRIPGCYHLFGYAPVFNSGEKFCVSDRTWGGIMAQALYENNSSGMSYARWMFPDPNEKPEDFPELKVDRKRMARPGAVLQYDDPLDEEYYTIGPPLNAPRPVGNVVKEIFVSRKFTKKKKGGCDFI